MKLVEFDLFIQEYSEIYQILLINCIYLYKNRGADIKTKIKEQVNTIANKHTKEIHAHTNISFLIN